LHISELLNLLTLTELIPLCILRGREGKRRELGTGRRQEGRGPDRRGEGRTEREREGGEIE
jgi:hypothetical protein